MSCAFVSHGDSSSASILMMAWETYFLSRILFCGLIYQIQHAKISIELCLIQETIGGLVGETLGFWIRQSRTSIQSPDLPLHPRDQASHQTSLNHVLFWEWRPMESYLLQGSMISTTPDTVITFWKVLNSATPPVSSPHPSIPRPFPISPPLPRAPACSFSVH